MVRFALNLLLTATAVALLGMLVLLSTTADEDVRRHLDQTLRQLRDVGVAIERDAFNARNLNVDRTNRLESLERDLRAGIEGVSRDLGVLYPSDPSTAQRFRAGAEVAFNSIAAEAGPDRDELWRGFVALDQSTRWFADKAATFSRQHAAYLGERAGLGEASRRYVQTLRERGQSAQADAMFRAVQQVLERAQRGTESDLQQIEAIAARLHESQRPHASADRDAHAGIIDRIRALIPSRRGMEASLGEIANGRFQRQLADLRERVTGDQMFRLGIANDSRVLLNVYTVLLLAILGYFGFRLQLSYHALNRSHAALAGANESLEERVRERTQDLERALSDLKESQVQLVQAEKMSSLGQLVAGVVHEINTPLLYVLNNAAITTESVEELRAAIEHSAAVSSLVREHSSEPARLEQALTALAGAVDPEGVRETIDEIQALSADSTDGLNQISELVKSLKDFSRLDRANEDRFDVRDGLEKTLVMTRNLLKYGVDVVKQFDDVPDVLCAPSRINQVFINLITNAVQAMDGKGCLTIATRRCGENVEVSVRDTGSGIAPEHIGRIMEPFFTTKPVGQGTGLGLSIVRQIVDEHGGDIRVESEVGRGTEITVSLPIRRTRRAEAA